MNWEITIISITWWIARVITSIFLFCVALKLFFIASDIRKAVSLWYSTDRKEIQSGDVLVDSHGLEIDAGIETDCMQLFAFLIGVTGCFLLFTFFMQLLSDIWLKISGGVGIIGTLIACFMLWDTVKKVNKNGHSTKANWIWLCRLFVVFLSGLWILVAG